MVLPLKLFAMLLLCDSTQCTCLYSCVYNSKSSLCLQIVKKAQKAAQEFGGNGYESYSVRAQLAMLNKQWPVAESLLLAQGKVDECIAMYQEAHK